jgi:hypothetical protein
MMFRSSERFVLRLIALVAATIVVTVIATLAIAKGHSFSGSGTVGPDGSVDVMIGSQPPTVPLP